MDYHEFFKFGNFNILVEILMLLFDNMASMGYIPDNFNIAILIRKKGEI